MKEEHVCLICLGSNSNAAFHLTSAKHVLDSMFPEINWGEAMETEAEGIYADLPPYLNQLALFHTSLDIAELKTQLKQVEKRNGRTENCKKTGLIPLDIDLLVYDKQLLKPQDLKKRYMQLLISNCTSFPRFLFKNI